MDFEKKYGKRFRVYVDDSFKAETEKNKLEIRWRYLELRGKYGSIYPYSNSEVAVMVTGPKVVTKVRRLYPKWKVVQDADDATVFLVPETEITDAFRVIKPKKKKELTPEQKAQRAEILRRNKEVKAK